MLVIRTSWEIVNNERGPLVGAADTKCPQKTPFGCLVYPNQLITVVCKRETGLSVCEENKSKFLVYIHFIKTTTIRWEYRRAHRMSAAASARKQSLFVGTGKPPKAAPIGRMILCRFSEVAATRR